MAIFQNSSAPSLPSGYEIDNSCRFNDDDSAYLSRTPGSAGNRRTWTWSGWVKRGELGSYNTIFGAGNGGTIFDELRFSSNDKLEFFTYTNSTNGSRVSTAVFRDTSAWYHIVAVYDSTDSTTLDRMKLYVNGEQITELDTTINPSQNYQSNINNNIIHAVGAVYAGQLYNPYDGYLAEVNFIDGQALDPSNFGETGDYGEWKPIKYTGTYGTNGFYLDFSNSGSLGTDASSNSNNWTPNNLSATDQVKDSPTNNFCTWNPLDSSSTGTISEGNLRRVATTTSSAKSTGTMKFTNLHYFEVFIEGVGQSWGQYPMFGISRVYGGDYQHKYGGNIGLNSIGMVAVDANTGKIWIGSNGVWENSGDPAAGTGNYNDGSHTGYSPFDTEDDWFPFTMSYNTQSKLIANFGQDSSFAGNKTAQGNADSNGYGDFYYEPPSGFLALCTTNLDDPAEGLWSDGENVNFNTVTYSGTGASQSITGVGFQPDLVWAKCRNASVNNVLYDAVRGTGRLESNNTAAEGSRDGFVGFASDGFNVDGDGAGGNINYASGRTYVAWNWKANGSGLSNTDGSITSTVSANTTAGFSIVNYTGTGVSGPTVGHGLNSSPELIFARDRDAVGSWRVYDSITGGGNTLYLNNTTATTAEGDRISAVSSTTFTVNDVSAINYNGHNNIAYCFHSVDGYSKVGSYTGNGSTDGPFVYTGFRPAYVMVKRTNSTGGWVIWDHKRDTYNLTTTGLRANSTAGDTTDFDVDLISNGFKLRDVENYLNASGSTYIYIAFAENPFKYTNAR